MAIPLPHRSQVQAHHYKPHPYAHHVGFTAALIGMLSIPLGFLVFPPLIAIALGIWAVMLSLHPAPGFNARPEGWAAIIMGLMGLAFGLAQLTITRFV